MPSPNTTETFFKNYFHFFSIFFSKRTVTLFEVIFYSKALLKMFSHKKIHFFKSLDQASPLILHLPLHSPSTNTLEPRLKLPIFMRSVSGVRWWRAWRKRGRRCSRVTRVSYPFIRTALTVYIPRRPRTRSIWARQCPKSCIYRGSSVLNLNLSRGTGVAFNIFTPSSQYFI